MTLKTQKPFELNIENKNKKRIRNKNMDKKKN